MGRPAPNAMMEYPQLRQLRFEPLPYITHPIDTYEGPQGWGPFYGAWTPIDFADPAADISIYYGMGESNDWQFAPPYDVLTLFEDRSLELAWNTTYDVDAERRRSEQEMAYTSTIANVVPRNSSMMQRLRDILKGPVKT